MDECFIDKTFVTAKRGRAVGKTERGKGTKLVVAADNASLPLAVHVAPASPHEVTLVGAENFLGFVHLGCIKILPRCYL